MAHEKHRLILYNAADSESIQQLLAGWHNLGHKRLRHTNQIPMDYMFTQQNLVVVAEVGERDQLLRVVLLCVRQLKGLVADVVVECWDSSRAGVAWTKCES